MLEQLKKNQKALTSGLEDLLMVQQSPDVQQQETTSLPIGYKPEMFKADIDSGFNADKKKEIDKAWFICS